MLNHGLYLFWFHAFHHVLKLVDLACDQRRAAFIPVPYRLAQQISGLRCQAGQDRRQVNGQLAEEVQGDRADVLQLSGAVRVLGQLPRLSSLDVRICPVCQLHHQPHGAVVVALFIRLGNFFPFPGGVLEEAFVVRIGGGQSAAGHKLCGTAGQVDHFAHQVGVDLGHQFVQVQIQIIDARRQL